MSAHVTLRLPNAIAATFAMALPLQYALPKNALCEQDTAKVIALAAAGVGFYVGLNVAQRTQEYFQKRIEKSQKDHATATYFDKDTKNLKSLLISLGMGATFYVLNTPHFNQIFERSAPFYLNVLLRGIGYGYMCLHTIKALDALFYEV